VSEYAEFDDEERMTYQPVTLIRERLAELKQVKARICELEVKLEDQAATHARLMVENADLQAKLDAVPLAALRFIASAPCRQWDRAESDQAWAQLEAWLQEQGEG
jgi:hypothetical protein